MSIELGDVPDDLTVHLTTGADFDPTLVLTDENDAEIDWPVGTELTLRFARRVAIEATWTATIVGSEATFDEDKTAVEAMIAAERLKVRLCYVNGDDDEVWAIGEVVVHA